MKRPQHYYPFWIRKHQTFIVNIMSIFDGKTITNFTFQSGYHLTSTSEFCKIMDWICFEEKHLKFYLAFKKMKLFLTITDIFNYISVSTFLHQVNVQITFFSWRLMPRTKIYFKVFFLPIKFYIHKNLF